MQATGHRPDREPATPTSVVVVGGGISGLVAAAELAERLRPSAITVLEAGAAVGGLLRPVDVGGFHLDAGAESLLARRPETDHLLALTGLDGDRVAPTASAARILARGRLHPVPPRTLLGVPGDPAAALGILDPPEVAALEGERTRRHRPLEADDVDVQGFLAARLGGPVVARLVEPLLAGVYAGRADRLGLRAVLPALWPAAREGRSVVEAVAAALPARAASAAPVFAGIAGGLHRLPCALAERLRKAGVQVVTGARVVACQVRDQRWEITVEGARDGRIEAGGLLIAVPAPRAAALLRPAVPLAAAPLAAVRTAHVAVVAVRLPSGVLPPDAGTGVLVAPGQLPTVKAVTLSTRKWGWLAEETRGRWPGADVVRLSVGRAGDEVLATHDDDQLVRLALADLDRIIVALGRPAGGPVASLLGPDDVRVVRWYGALPQYEPGHLDRLAAVRTALDGAPAPVRLAGSVVDGVGVPACVATARAAAADLADALTRGVTAGATGAAPEG